MAAAAVKDEKCAICDKALSKKDKEELLETQCGHKYHVPCVQKRRDKKKKMDCKVKGCGKVSALQQALIHYGMEMWKSYPKVATDQRQAKNVTDSLDLLVVSSSTSL